MKINDPLQPMFDLLTQRHPTLTVHRSADDRKAVIMSADGTGSMHVDFWVQQRTPCVATTYQRGTLFAPGDHLHYWIGIRDSGGAVPASPSRSNFRHRCADLRQGNLSGGLFQSNRLGLMNWLPHCDSWRLGA
jgi:hypothetical protein